MHAWPPCPAPYKGQRAALAAAPPPCSQSRRCRACPSRPPWLPAAGGNSCRSRAASPPVSRSTRPSWPPLPFPWLIRACRPPEPRRRRKIRPPRIQPPAPPLFGIRPISFISMRDEHSLDPACFSSALARVTRPPQRPDGRRFGAARSSCARGFEGRRRHGSFAIKSLDFLVNLRSFLCLGKTAENPLQRSHFHT
jgi:hypothetical protein